MAVDREFVYIEWRTSFFFFFFFILLLLLPPALFVLLSIYIYIFIYIYIYRSGVCKYISFRPPPPHPDEPIVLPCRRERRGDEPMAFPCRRERRGDPPGTLRGPFGDPLGYPGNRAGPGWRFGSQVRFFPLREYPHGDQISIGHEHPTVLQGINITIRQDLDLSGQISYIKQGFFAPNGY